MSIENWLTASSGSATWPVASAGGWSPICPATSWRSSAGWTATSNRISRREESWLYPQIEATTGSPWVTRFARFDHHQIRDMGARVAADQQALRGEGASTHLRDLKCHLFGLEVLVRAHLEREERYLIPLLEDETTSVAPATTGR